MRFFCLLIKQKWFWETNSFQKQLNIKPLFLEATNLPSRPSIGITKNYDITLIKVHLVMCCLSSVIV